MADDSKRIDLSGIRHDGKIQLKYGEVSLENLDSPFMRVHLIDTYGERRAMVFDIEKRVFLNHMVGLDIEWDAELVAITDKLYRTLECHRLHQKILSLADGQETGIAKEADQKILSLADGQETGIAKEADQKILSLADGQETDITKEAQILEGAAEIGIEAVVQAIRDAGVVGEIEVEVEIEAEMLFDNDADTKKKEEDKPG